MRRQPYVWSALVLAVCAGRASAQEEEAVVQAFERMGAIVKRDDTNPKKPVIALVFGLRPPIPDTTSEWVKDIVVGTTGLYEKYYVRGIVRVRPSAKDAPSGSGTKATDGPRNDGAKPLDPSFPTAIKVIDADLQELSKLVNLQVLDLSYGEITNKALERLKTPKNLQTLDLRNTQVSDAGLAMGYTGS
jgi:hypothetical protein